MMLRQTAEPWDRDADPNLLQFFEDKCVMAHKDLDAARALGEELGVPMPCAALTDARVERIFFLPEPG
jgi:hypothetical protein